MSADGTRARYDGCTRARLRVLSWRAGRGHQRRLFPAACGQARRLSLQSAGGVQGRPAQIPADELSAGISSRRVSERDGGIFCRAAARRFPPPAPPTVSSEILARGELLVKNGDPQHGIPPVPAAMARRSAVWSPAIPGLLGLRASYISAQLGAWRYGTRTAAAPDCMQIVASSLTEDDVKAVAAYLASRPAPADPTFAPRGSLRDAACVRQPAELKGDRAYAENLASTAPGSRCLAAGRCDARRAAQDAGADRERRISRPRRRLHRLPYRARRQDVCRRTADEDAVRHALYVEHHARSADRHRHLDLRSVLPDDAQRPLSRRRAGLSGDAVCLLHQGDARGQRCDLRLSAFGRRR